MRTGLSLPRTQTTDEARIEVAENATCLEDFHNYDHIDRPGYWGRCRCQLRIVTGSECLHHFECNEEGETPSSANSHWAWFIDIAPRMEICPFVKQAQIAGIGTTRPCDILIGIAPPAAWVLEQDPGAKAGTWPGRVQDIVVSGVKCMRCRNPDKVLEDNMAEVDQAAKTEFYGLNPISGKPIGGSEQPIQYRPKNEKSAHWSLKIGQLYIKGDIMNIPGVDHEDLWIPELGQTFATFMDPNAASPSPPPPPPAPPLSLEADDVDPSTPMVIESSPEP